MNSAPEKSMFNSSKRVRTLSQRITIGKYDISEFVLRGTTMKALGDPAGQWELELRPSILNGTVVNLGDINMNDICEIRLGVIDEENKDPPVIMRGLVDAVKVTESMQKGSPIRSIKISGRDFGKIFTEKNIVPPVEYINSISIGRQKLLFELLQNSTVREGTSGLNDTAQTKGTIRALIGYSKFMENIFSQVLTSDFLGFDAINQLIKDKKITYNINIPTNAGEEEYIINSQYTILYAQGAFWTWLSTFIPAPMFEFLVVDYDEKDTTVHTDYRGKTVCHLRWSPFRNKWGFYPPKGRSLAGTLAENEVNVPAANQGLVPFFDEEKFVQAGNRAFIGRNEIISKSLMRNDNETKSFFFTKWRDYPIDENAAAGSQFPSTKKSFDCRSSPQFTNAGGPDNYGLLNCSLNNGNDAFNPLYDILGMSRFGFKPMIVAVPFWNQTVYKTEETHTSGEDKNNITRILDNINQWMYDVFTQQHNLFVGEISMIGNPYIRIGQELFIVPDVGKNAEARSTQDDYEMFYVEKVSHSWSFHPSVAFQTSLQVSRGTKVPYALTGLSQDITTDPNMAWEGLPIAGTSLVTTLPSAEDLLAKLYATGEGSAVERVASADILDTSISNAFVTETTSETLGEEEMM